MIEAAAARGKKFNPGARDQFARIIIAVDPPVTTGPNADACGIIVAGLATPNIPAHTTKTSLRDANVVILHDGTVAGRSPEGWAERVNWLHRFYSADYIVVEVNQGGDMVKTVLRQADPNIILRTVRAARSKVERAAPIALLYEQGRVAHAARFKALEDELCALGVEGSDRNNSSPDRADALVWAVTDLLLKQGARPRIRAL